MAQQEFHQSVHLRAALNTMRNGAGFAHFDLGMSPADLELWNSLSVTPHDGYENFGALDDLPQDAEVLFREMGNAPKSASFAAANLGAVVDSIVKEFGAETAWVAIRPTTDTGVFEVPRWHTDGGYFSTAASGFYGDTSEHEVKALLTIKGASSRLADVPVEVRHQFRALMDAGDEKALDDLVCPYQITSKPHGTGTLIAVGDHPLAAVHSEPHLNHDRIFVSVLPGTHQQIKDLRQGWGAPSRTPL